MTLLPHPEVWVVTAAALSEGLSWAHRSRLTQRWLGAHGPPAQGQPITTDRLCPHCTFPLSLLSGHCCHQHPDVKGYSCFLTLWPNQRKIPLPMPLASRAGTFRPEVRSGIWDLDTKRMLAQIIFPVFRHWAPPSSELCCVCLHHIIIYSVYFFTLTLFL